MPDRSTAEQITFVEPKENTLLPTSGHDTVTKPPLSVAVAIFQLTRAVGRFASVGTVMLEAHEITGGVTSAMVMTKEHVALLLDVSTAMHLTVVFPRANNDPEAGLHETA